MNESLFGVEAIDDSGTIIQHIQTWQPVKLLDDKRPYIAVKVGYAVLESGYDTFILYNQKIIGNKLLFTAARKQ